MEQVAFSRSGDFFVADGYCNSRVIRYSSDGASVREYTLPVRCMVFVRSPAVIFSALKMQDCHNLSRTQNPMTWLTAHANT